MVKAEIFKRRPADPNDEPFSLVLVEVAALMKNKGISTDIAEQAPLLRSRKLQSYFSLQELEQMSEELRAHIWSIGNIVCFAMSNFNEAYEMAQQLFRYDPNTIKRDARSDTGQPIVETDRGQYLQIANDIQRLNHRECIVRRYLSERQMDKYVQWVRKTKDKPRTPHYIDGQELKAQLIKARAVKIEDALKVINRRIEAPHKPSGTAPSL